MNSICDISGTCLEMCPQQERAEREGQKRLWRFELTSGTEKWKFPTADPLKAVKEYSRSAAGKTIDKSSLRPATVLLKTVDYLLSDILNDFDNDKSDVYHFITDRLRAVKQDLVIQRIAGKDAIEILEKSLRFYIYGKYKYYGEEFFDIKLHNTQIKDYVHLLKEIYRSEKEYKSTNQLEFEAYFLLIEINSNAAYREALTLPDHFKKSQIMTLVLKIIRNHREKNYVRFFRLLEYLPFLFTCSLYDHIGGFRSQVFNIMCTAYNSKIFTFPLEKLTSLLAYDDKEQAEIDCRSHSLEISFKGIHFQKGTFNHRQGTNEIKSYKLIDKKICGPVSDELLKQG